MIEVISARFKNKGKVYFFDPAGLTIPSDVDVIVETSKGLEYAFCTCGNHTVEDTAIIPPLRPVIRIATEEDRRKAEENKAKEIEAFAYCQKKISEHQLEMKLVDVEFSFEGSKILFFFTSDGRVDFRELVKDLAAMFKTRIELRQIGVRDEARMLGGLGNCGKPFCCSQFLEEFHPVSIKMAKTQGLSLNPVKISGTCGRLMCCLKYEEYAYEDLVKKAPKTDAFVETPAGKGTVISVNLLRGNAKVRLEEGMDTTLKTFTFEELDVLGGKARRAEYIAARAEGKLEEAGFTPRPRPAPEQKPSTRPSPRPEPVFSPAPPAESKPDTATDQHMRNDRRRQKPFQKTAPMPPRQDRKPAPPPKEAVTPKEALTPRAATPLAEATLPLEAIPVSAEDALGKKPQKRHHRGGKNRNKNPGQRPLGDGAAAGQKPE